MVSDSKKNRLATLVAPPAGTLPTSGPEAALGKNRASPPSTPKNREFVRVATASRLMASHWKKTGENLRGSSVLGCGRWRNYGPTPTLPKSRFPTKACPGCLGTSLVGLRGRATTAPGPGFRRLALGCVRR